MTLSQNLAYLLFLCCVVCIIGPRDLLWDAVFDADVPRVQSLLAEDRSRREIGRLTPDPLRIEKDTHRNALMMCGYIDDERSRTEIDEACFAITQIMYDNGANIALVDKYGWNVLAMAAVRGLTKTCELLLNLPIARGGDVYIDVNRQDNDGMTPVLLAAGHGHIDTVEMFYNHPRAKANLYAVDKQSRSALMLVVNMAANNETAHLNTLQKMAKLILNTSKRERQNVMDRNPGADIRRKKFLTIDYPVDKDGRTPLHYAVISNSYSTVQLLLKYGADPRITDSKGVSSTSMLRAHVNQNQDVEEIRDLLLEAVVEITEKEHLAFMDVEGMTLDFSEGV
jgi:ankyrin repeat protein